MVNLETVKNEITKEFRCDLNTLAQWDALNSSGKIVALYNCVKGNKPIVRVLHSFSDLIIEERVYKTSSYLLVYKVSIVYNLCSDEREEVPQGLSIRHKEGVICVR